MPRRMAIGTPSRLPSRSRTSAARTRAATDQPPAPVTGGTGVVLRTSARAPAAVAPRRLRSRLTTSRCSRTAGATALTSSGVTNARPRERRRRLRGPVERDGRPRARPELDVGVAAGRAHERHRVCLDLVGDEDRPHEVAQGEQPVPRDDGLDRLERVGGRLVAARDPSLPLPVGVAHPRPEQEPVELRLGQRERALELDGVLRREHEERVGQAVGRPLDADLALLHRLEQRALRARRRAVDLVDEQQVREHRPLDEPEAAGLEQARAGDVRGQQVRRALDARHAEVEAAGDRAGEERLAGARDVLEEDVPVGEQRDRDEADRAPPRRRPPGRPRPAGRPTGDALRRRRRVGCVRLCRLRHLVGHGSGRAPS